MKSRSLACCLINHIARYQLSFVCINHRLIDWFAGWLGDWLRMIDRLIVYKVFACFSEWQCRWPSNGISQSVNQWMSEPIDEWTNGWVNQWVCESVSEGMSEWVNEWGISRLNEFGKRWVSSQLKISMNKWVSERANDWANGYLSKWMSERVRKWWIECKIDLVDN